jgi:hypothetical protein
VPDGYLYTFGAGPPPPFGPVAVVGASPPYSLVRPASETEARRSLREGHPS